MTPVVVTKDGQEEKVFHAPDLQGWLDAGWKVKQPKKGGRPKKEESKDEEEPQSKGIFG